MPSFQLSTWRPFNSHLTLWDIASAFTSRTVFAYSPPLRHRRLLKMVTKRGDHIFEMYYNNADVFGGLLEELERANDIKFPRERYGSFLLCSFCNSFNFAASSPVSSAPKRKKNAYHLFLFFSCQVKEQLANLSIVCLYLGPVDPRCSINS